MFDKITDYIKSILDNADITYFSLLPSFKDSLYFISNSAILFITRENTNKILIINTTHPNNRPRLYLSLSSPTFKEDLIRAMS